MLLLMAGLPGTGKTTVARQLAERLQVVILNKDVVRHALFPPGFIEYSTEQDDFVIDVLLRTAEYIWSKHPKQVVLLDGRTFSRAAQRKHVIEFAVGHYQPWRMIECVCTDNVARARLAQPDPAHPAGNRTGQLYDEVKSRWEPITEKHLTVHTDRSIDIEDIFRELAL